MKLGAAFFWNHMGIPFPQPAVPTMSPWLSNMTFMLFASVRFKMACSLRKKSASKAFSSRGCAPAQTTPKRIKFHPTLLIWFTSAWLKVEQVEQLPAAVHALFTTSLQILVPDTDGNQGGPLTTMFGPPKTTGALVPASTKRCP